MNNTPLASLLRPDDLDHVFGQRHLLARGQIFREAIETGRIPNMVFYGPSGVGKTTVANIIAKRSNMQLYKLNGTSASIGDIKAAIADSKTLLGLNGILVYLDEIQYFNKKQQQSLLEFIEDGRITLIASTTENPYFCVFNAILSRSTVFEFKPVSAGDAEIAVSRAIAIKTRDLEDQYELEDGVIKYISQSCGGDVRKAMNSVELLFNAAEEKDGKKHISLEDAKTVSQKSAMRYDRDGDEHFDILSALMKSLRGSDPDAALHYLARACETGDLTGICRRILCSASEDIGMAYPMAVPIVKACVDSALQLGLPEARLPLAEACVLLATSPKSNSVVMAIDSALSDVRTGKAGPIPRELQNVHADGTGFEREQGYLYPHDFPNHWVKQQYLPDELRNARYYEYGDNKTEQAAKAYWDKIKNGK